MLTKFETKSNRVKGLAFHPKRPWVLASLHNGSIQLWDYRMGTLIDRFDEHEGPVRAVHFHQTQPLFVSGSDDAKIKLWNYKLRRCIFTLTGHLDYIRTVYFHHESPWLVSASDDLTIRVWNWQNRSCLAILTGHNHYVMCAQFHPLDDIVVSASLDQTIRVWDISPLRHRSSGPSDQSQRTIMNQVRGRMPAALNAEFIGSGDAVVKYVLEGHTRGVNWVSFHPTMPLIVSGADDRQVKLWRMSETTAWEVDTFRNHVNNVSCVLFHPRQDLIISDGEDKTIRVWDLNRRNLLHTFRRENDRFWILAVHSSVNLIAAGHDTGMIVFKLLRERPAFAVSEGNLLFVKDNYIRSMSFDTGRNTPILLTRKVTAQNWGSSMFASSLVDQYGGSDGSGAQLSSALPRGMSYNARENYVILTYDTDGGSYELYQLPRGASSESVVEPRRGEGIGACFVGRNRLAVLDRARTSILVKDLRNETTKRVPCLLPGADGLFPAGTGYVLVKNEEKVILQDLQQKKLVAEIGAMSVKYVVWSDDMSRLVLLGKHSLLIATRRLEHLATVHETVRVKSAAWDESGVIIYTTLNHLKYCLPNGDNGIVNTLKDPVYLTRVRGPGVCYIDRNGQPGMFAIDPTEYAFKLLLLRKRYDDVRRMISENRLCGKAIIAYLQRKGFPEVALHFVRDERTRFNLAVDSGAVDIALQAARELDDPEAWATLASTALKLGSIDVVELCYQKSRDLERLAFLYVLLGDRNKLEKVAGIAHARHNHMARFQIALFQYNVEDVAATLHECGQSAMARLMARTHGLDELVEQLGGSGGGAGEDGAADTNGDESVNGGTLLPRPLPLSSERNWPTLPVSRALFRRDPHAEEFEEPGGDYYEDAATFEASEREREREDWGEEGKAAAGGRRDGAAAAGRRSPRAAAAAAAASPAAAQAPRVDPFAVDVDESEAQPPSPGGGGWGEDDLEFDFGDDGAAGGNGGAAAGGGEDDFDDGAEWGGRRADGDGGGADAVARQYYVPILPGAGLDARWRRSAMLAGELVAAGAFKDAMQLLSRQIGAVDFAPFREPFRSVFVACRAAFAGVPNLSSNLSYLSRGGESADGQERPHVAISLASLQQLQDAGYKSFTDGKFDAARRTFRALIAGVPLLSVDSDKEVLEAERLKGVCREYLTALNIEAAQREARRGGDNARLVQLAGLFTTCALEASHVQLALRAAMKYAHDTKNYALASGFARRMLETNPRPQVADAAKRIIQFCDKNMTNANEVDYDARRSFVVESAELVPLYANQTKLMCSYCKAGFEQSKADHKCTICSIGRVGGVGEGLRIKRA